MATCRESDLVADSFCARPLSVGRDSALHSLALRRHRRIHSFTRASCDIGCPRSGDSPRVRRAERSRLLPHALERAGGSARQGQCHDAPATTRDRATRAGVSADRAGRHDGSLHVPAKHLSQVWVCVPNKGAARDVCVPKCRSETHQSSTMSRLREVEARLASAASKGAHPGSLIRLWSTYRAVRFSREVSITSDKAWMPASPIWL